MTTQGLNGQTSSLRMSLAFADLRTQRIARRLGLQRRYFDLREMARARSEKLDTALNRRTGALFIHVPKCAGTTIARQVPLSHGHRSASFLRWAEPDLFRRSFTFGFVRNPHDRFVSAYHYLRSDRTSARDGRFGQRYLAHYESFETFVRDLRKPAIRDAILSWMHFLPQTFYLSDRSGNVLVDYVGRLETFAEDLDFINARTGLTLKNEVARATDHADFRAHYTSETAEIVADIYSEDFATFGYDRASVFDRGTAIHKTAEVVPIADHVLPQAAKVAPAQVPLSA